MTLHLHSLKGCAPAPLAHYLKALGVLRLVGQQADPDARGWWDCEEFCLLTKLSESELEAFFLEKYEPTPLLSPWNKGCGFFKADDPGLVPLEKSTAKRFEAFRSGIGDSRSLIGAIETADAVVRAIKARTKTVKKSFQTPQQRKILRNSEAFLRTVAAINEALSKEGLEEDGRKELNETLISIESLVSDVDKPPSKAEAKALKDSPGYKRLLASADRVFSSLKATLIPDCQRVWRGPISDWMAAAVVLNEAGEPDWPSLLGTGGNDGNLDFTNNFMQQLGLLFDVTSAENTSLASTRELLNDALFSDPSSALTGTAIGQFLPGSAGGANSSTGFDGGALVNPWDFVLMMEGTLLLSSRATRRLDPTSLTRASAPFSVRSHSAGFATPGTEKAQRGEQWMPLWKQPATLNDVSAMFGEARLQLDRQLANRPVDVARAVSRLGVARGIDSFVRYGYLERNGQSTLAVPLGRVRVRQHPRSHLVDDLGDWMNRLQMRARDKNAPARLIHAERRLANAVFAALTHDPTPDLWQAILLAAADIEAIQAAGTAIEPGPIPTLRPEWVEAVNDGSVELRLALALASAQVSYSADGKAGGPARHHVLPLEQFARKFKTADKRLAHDTRVVMTSRDAVRDLAALVERRMIEAEQSGRRRLGLAALAGCGARLDDLAQLLDGHVDLDRTFRLARAFMAIDWRKWDRKYAPSLRSSDDRPDEAWLAIRLAVMPSAISETIDIPADPRVIRLLMSGDGSRAIEIARRRIRAVGIRPPFVGGMTDSVTAQRWAAALAFPIHRSTAQQIVEILDPSKKGLVHV
jgi:CRISPR-associated protein Csx17